MMGRLEAQENLFYRFRIEDHVPENHLLCNIDLLLDFDAIMAFKVEPTLAKASNAEVSPMTVAPSNHGIEHLGSDQNTDYGIKVEFRSNCDDDDAWFSPRRCV